MFVGVARMVETSVLPVMPTLTIRLLAIVVVPMDTALAVTK